eukprot:gnl/MRDRNA2_/MRDRNA2_82897_c0_seq3.p1 gnl/MRDRNA2_/MRDRNA2_82897_c0~~gnl/MRDRNA2_/MRDRNA2_82897_c0_seq3.p1  ORF type:complete len:368 (+),score=65.78 gnl/MRDRNA2_/MRDRNA2_82897_c0_seq3:70-1173(+)
MARDENTNTQNRHSAQSQEESKFDVAAGQRAAFKPYHALSVPKRAKLHTSQKGPIQAPTTMMLRNIPNLFTQSALRQEIDNSGFADSYNFFYLPMDTKNHANVGYAFVNFLKSSDATRFFEAFSGYRFNQIRSRKLGEVAPAYIQGLEKNLQYFQDKVVSKGHHSPIVVIAGQVVDVDQALASLSGDSKIKVSLANFIDPCPSTSGHPVQSVMQQAVSITHQCETNVPIAFPDALARSSGKHRPLGSGLSKHERKTSQQLCLAGYVCPDEPCYLEPGAFSGKPATMIEPPPGLESPESWRHSALPPEDSTTALQDALESMQKLSLSTGAQKNESAVFDADASTPRTHVSLLAECYSAVGSIGDKLSW